MALADDYGEDREKIPIKDLIVSFNEKFDDYVIYSPWNPKEYIVEIGNRLLGFGEKSFLISTLNKIKHDYGDEIPVSLISTKVIPEITEPLIRRHGNKMPNDLIRDIQFIGKWIVYQDDELQNPLVIVLPSYANEPQHMEILEHELGRPPKPTGKHVRGYFCYFPLLNKAGALVVHEQGFTYKDFQHVLDYYLDKYAERFNLPSQNPTEQVANERNKVFVYANKKKVWRIEIIGKPKSDIEELYIENKSPDAITWEMITGDENSNRRPNEPEWWVPVRQMTQSSHIISNGRHNMFKLKWEKKSCSTVVKEDMKKYINPGQQSKLEYPKPPAQKVLDTMTKGESGDLQFGKKNATETIAVKEKDIRVPGQQEKLEYNKEVKWPSEGDVKSVDVSSEAKPFMDKGTPGNIQKSKPFSVDPKAEAEKVKFDDSKYRLSWDSAKPIQKQFSLQSSDLGDWMEELRARGYDRKARRAFRYAWITAAKAGQDPVKVASAALADFTPGSSKESDVITEPYLPDVVGFVLTSFLKFAKECPKCFQQLMDAVDTYQYYPALDEVSSEKESLKTEAKVVSAEMTMADLEKKRDELQKQLAEVQKQIADMAQKIVNNTEQ